MPDNQNITKIPAPRVSLLDEKTGLISREWFRFLNNLYVITGGGNQGIIQIENGGTGASTAAEALANLGAGSVTRVGGTGTVSGITLTGNVTTSGDLVLGGALEDIDIDTQTTGSLDISTRVTGVLPVANGGTSAVVTKVTDFILDDTEGWVINNKSGSSCTVTLPDASAWAGRRVTFKNLQAQTLVSGSGNVAPIGSATPGTAILPASVGAWATLVSDGVNWVIMQS